MKKKGFTLIELLAVIVILAIIALIATPIILGTIDKAKKGAAESSALLYVSALENQVILNASDSSKNNINDGVYNDINILDVYYNVNVKNGPQSGILEINKGMVKYAKLCINGYMVDYSDNKAKTIGTCGLDESAPIVKTNIIGGELSKDTENQDWYVSDNVVLEIKLQEIFTYDDNEIIGGSGIDEDSLRVTINDEEVQVYKASNNTYNFVIRNPGINEIKIIVKDNNGNETIESTVIKIDNETPVISVKSNPLSLGNQDYSFADNLDIDYGELGGTVVCDPSSSNKTGTYTVTCKATGNNGRVTEEISFNVRHSYSATKVTYNATNNTHSHSSGCYTTQTIGHSGGIASSSYTKNVDGKTYYCDVTFSDGCHDSGCHTNGYHYEHKSILSCNKSTAANYSCPNGGSLSGTTCVYYTCPNGGKLSGSTCNY